MKKNFILFVLLLMFIQTKAQQQSLYTQTTFTADYTDLDNTIPINNGADWYDEGYAVVNAPFPFKIAGQTIGFFTWTGFGFVCVTDSQDAAYQLLTSGLVVKERPSEVGVPQSSMAYKVEGEEGSRILKIEVKNAGLTAETVVNSTTNLFLNSQIWIYEETNVIEYRYGTSNITAADLVTYNISDVSNFFLTGILGNNVYNCFVYNDLTAPTFVEFFQDEGDQDWGPYRITTYPAEKTVYRFAPYGSTVSTEEFNKTQFRIYPNPVKEVLTVSLEKMDVKAYTITDMTGKMIRQGNFESLENTLNLADLSSGMYFIKVGNSTQKFVKK